MKNLIFIFIFTFGFANAQRLIDETDDAQFLNEAAKATIKFDMKYPLEYYRLKCTNPVYAQFPGGEENFKHELFKNMIAYLDNNTYAVNGTFLFVFEIGTDGKISNFTLKPNVLNGDMLFKDLNFIVKKTNEKWKSSTCEGKPVSTKVRLKVDFRTENFDL